MSHVNKVIDADPHFVIDINTRNIKNVSQTKTTLVQYDHNSERFSFTLPRFVEGHDMMECNSVQVRYFSSANPDTKGLYEIDDLSICEEDTENVCCTWLISRNVTQTAGAMLFMLRFACLADDGTEDYAWHTNQFRGISISAGMNNAEAVAEQYADILEQWRIALFSLNEEGIRNINTAKATAIESIESTGERIIESLPDDYMELSEKADALKNASNLYLEETAVIGYLEANGNIRDTYDQGTETSDFIEVKPGETLTAQCWVNVPSGSGAWSAIGYYDSAKRWIKRDAKTSISTIVVGNYTYYTYTITVPADAYYIRVSTRTYWDSKIQIRRGDITSDWTPALMGLKERANKATKKATYDFSHLKPYSVNHRGYATAPENTIPAVLLSKAKGFDFVECDVQFTSDGIPVMLHDDTIDRTSNGTGNIKDKTLAEVRALDFGSWKSEEYTGTTIPTFEEFIKLCRDINIYPYIELKTSAGRVNQAMINGLVDIVKKYNMENAVTWIGFAILNLERVVKACPTARVGLLSYSELTDEQKKRFLRLRQLGADIFLDVKYDTINLFLTFATEKDIPIEIYGTNSAEDVRNVSATISGATCDSLILKEVLHKSATGEYDAPILTAPNGTKYKLTVDDNGNLTTTEI